MISKSKISIGVLCGGRSPEHEVSLFSARTVHDVVDKHKYDVTVIKLHESGSWDVIANLDSFPPPTRELCLETPCPAAEVLQGIVDRGLLDGIDVIFPVIHGVFGEDGCLQGMLRLLNIPFVGADVLGSAVGMDKDVMKRLLSQAGLPTVEYMVAKGGTTEQFTYRTVTERLGESLFVKPANAGSSIGVSKVCKQSDFDPAVDRAFRFDSKILFERAIDGREFECAVLGGDEPIASCVGEVLLTEGFYSYEAKYDPGIEIPMSIPAILPSEISTRLRQLAVSAYTTLECFGFGRVDFFLSNDGELYINELNTLPCLSHNYPRLWEASGVSLSELVDKLIQLALTRYRMQNDRCRVYGRTG